MRYVRSSSSYDYESETMETEENGGDGGPKIGRPLLEEEENKKYKKIISNPICSPQMEGNIAHAL